MKNYLGLNVLNQSVYHLILKIKVLRRISFLKSILESIYFKTVIPSILYGVVVYGSSPNFKEL